MVQIRQPVEHKKTMLYLEQMLLKHNICEKAQSIKEMPGGLDIYWGSKSGANHLVEFLKGVVPIRNTMAKKLISQDDNRSAAHHDKRSLTVFDAQTVSSPSSHSLRSPFCCARTTATSSTTNTACTWRSHRRARMISWRWSQSWHPCSAVCLS